MSFVAVQFGDEEGGKIALVHTKWLTPLENEVFWLPDTTQTKLRELLTQEISHYQTIWKVYSIINTSIVVVSYFLFIFNYM